MRTTLTLDPDVAARLRLEARRSGHSFKSVVNGLLRLALSLQKRSAPVAKFVVKARPLGLRPGLNYDNAGELLDQIEGPEHR